MTNAKTLARVHTHTHTGSLIKKINIKIKIDRDTMLVSEFNTG